MSKRQDGGRSDQPRSDGRKERSARGGAKSSPSRGKGKKKLGEVTKHETRNGRTCRVVDARTSHDRDQRRRLTVKFWPVKSS